MGLKPGALEEIAGTLSSILDLRYYCGRYKQCCAWGALSHTIDKMSPHLHEFCPLYEGTKLELNVVKRWAEGYCHE